MVGVPLWRGTGDDWENQSWSEVYQCFPKSNPFLNLFKTRKAPPPKQLAVGGAAGWAAGYLTMKVNTLNWLFFKLDEKMYWMWFCAWCRQARWQQLPLEGPCCFSRLPITRATLRFTFSFAKLSRDLLIGHFLFVAFEGWYTGGLE